MRRFVTGRYVSPVDAPWREAIDERAERAIARYRFLPSRSARLKTFLDIAAVLYLGLVAAAWSMRGLPAALSGSAVLATANGALTLEPFRPDWLLCLRTDYTVSAFLVAAILLHESYWLRRRIYREWSLSPLSVPSLLPRLDPSPPTWQRAITRISAVVNHVVMIGVLIVGTHYLWAARRLPMIEDPLIRASVVFAGILLSVIGAFNLVEVLDDKEAPFPVASLRILAAALLSGIAFGTAAALGLRRGIPAGLLAFSFGFGVPVGAWACGAVMRRANRSSFSEQRGGGWQHQILIPLIAVGRIVDVLLRVAIGMFALPRTLLLAGSAQPTRDRSRRAIDDVETFEQVGVHGGFVHGYLHRPEPLTRKFAFTDRVRSALLRGLLKGDGWFPRRLRRQPIRLLRGGGAWEREDPLDFSGRVERRIGSRPSLDDVDFLTRRLLALFLTLYALAWVVEVALGHLVLHAGRPLLGHGRITALAFGLVTGLAFTLIAGLGRSTLDALAVGLVSGLALDPTTGLGEGLAFRFGHYGPTLAVAFVLLLVTTTLGRRALGMVGALALAVGLYLQAVPFLRSY